MKKQSLLDLAERSKYDRGHRVLKGTQEFVTYRDDMSVRVWYGIEPDFYSDHWHAAAEIVLPHQGSMIYNIDGKTYTIGEKDVLFIPAGKVHNMETPPGSVRNLILFDPACLNALRLPDAVRPVLEEVVLLTDEENEPICGNVRVQLFQMMRDYYAQTQVDNLTCYSFLFQVYALLGQYYLETHAEEHSEDHDGLMTEPVRQALNRVFDFVNEHYAEKITLDNAAAIAGFSKFYFSRIFSQFTHVTFSHYLLTQRINAASKLLCSSDQRLIDIAIQSGFSSLSTFNRVFKNHHGCTPTEYRLIYHRTPDHP